MKFFILGDSWAVGEWQKTSQGFESIPNTGLAHWLRQHGHTVQDISAGSAGNFGQLRHAYWTLDQNSDYDCAVWFYTEAIRDIEEIVINDPNEAAQQYPEFDANDYDQAEQYIHYQNCVYAQALSDRYQLPMIVVGGQSPVPVQLQSFNFNRHTVTSWMAELLNIAVPPRTAFNWSQQQRVMDHFGVDKQQWIQRHWADLEYHKSVQQLLDLSPKFPDNTHPNSDCHCELAERIQRYAGSL